MTAIWWRSHEGRKTKQSAVDMSTSWMQWDSYMKMRICSHSKTGIRIRRDSNLPTMGIFFMGPSTTEGDMIWVLHNCIDQQFDCYMCVKLLILYCINAAINFHRWWQSWVYERQKSSDFTSRLLRQLKLSRRHRNRGSWQLSIAPSEWFAEQRRDSSLRKNEFP